MTIFRCVGGRQPLTDEVESGDPVQGPERPAGHAIALPRWLKAVRVDDLPGLHTFDNGLEHDLVAADLPLPWSFGSVEGHINRIRMIKRQMRGRAGFGLLRKRVLLAA